MTNEREIRFLSTEDVMHLHARSIRKFGGSEGLRDPNLLDAAVSMPRQSFGGEFLHPDLASMTAAYHFHLAQNPPFIDGNKRIALAAAVTFLRVNNHRLNATNDEAYDITIRVATGDINKGELTNWWRERITPQPE